MNKKQKQKMGSSNNKDQNKTKTFKCLKKKTVLLFRFIFVLVRFSPPA